MVSAGSGQAGRAPLAAGAPLAAAGDESATVSWTPPADGGQPILSYTVTGAPAGQVVVGGGTTTVKIAGLINGRSYTFTVTAANVIGAGATSPPSNAVVPYGRTPARHGGPAPPPPGRGGVVQVSPPPGPPPRR
jgi:hypothetical protein